MSQIGLTSDNVRAAINAIHARMEVIGPELNELDGKIGDGDLGVTLVNGFNNMQQVAEGLPADVGMALFEGAKAMTKVSGSSFGTLMATALMAAGKEVKGQESVPLEAIPSLIQAALDAMIARGGASLGDKTVLDALNSIIKATSNADGKSGSLVTLSKQAAEETLTAFKDKQCKIGRARIFGERTVGMDDPGMVAVLRMLECL